MEFSASGAGPALIHDLDAELPTHSRPPFPFLDYKAQVLRPEFVGAMMPREMHRFYRIVPAAIYLNTFASDRSHMLIDGGACFAKPPPPYPCIVSARGERNTLPSFLEMPSPENAESECPYDPDFQDNTETTMGYGTVVTEGAFLEFLMRQRVITTK